MNKLDFTNLDAMIEALWSDAQEGDCLECAELPDDELCPDHQEYVE